MKIQLSDHFTYEKLIRFTLPSVIMMIVTSVYSIVDGFFVSNFAGKTPFTAVNFIMPVLMILGALGFMFGSGGSALIGKTMGEGKREEANRLFSMFVYITAGVGVLMAVLGILFLRPVAVALGAEGAMLADCVRYGRTILVALPAFMLQCEFQAFCVTAEKPHLDLILTVASGVANIILDALLVAVFPFGIVGAAVATAISQYIGGVVPLIYFSRPNSSLLRLTRTTFDGWALAKACANGSSELMSNISMSLVGMLYNVQLIRYTGNDGVAAYGVLMYVSMIFMSAFFGYSVGTAPVISFHYGAGHQKELQSLLRKSLVIITVCSVAMTVAAEALARPLSMLFVGYDPALLELTLRGFWIYSVSYLFAGIAIFGSSFFTALNNGLVSALISFLRTLVFQVLAVVLIPLLWDIDGIWFATVAAELLALAVTVLFLLKMRKTYGY